MKPQKQLPPVSPARRVYRPRYPGYSDPNPLLHPETMPYPFTARFTNWAAAGGLTGLLLFGGGEMEAQGVPDSLYNPFPLESARVPYRPVMYGTGLPQRLTTSETIMTIRKAFAASGIELEENVWLEDRDLGAYLNGYSKKEKIGFLLLEYGRMDESFRHEYGSKEPVDTETVPRPILADRLAAYHEELKEKFVAFVENKEQYLEWHTRPGREGPTGEFAAQLSALEPEESMLDTFIQYTNAYTIGNARKYRKKKSLSGRLMAMIEGHTSDPSLQAVLLNLTGSMPDKRAGEEYLKQVDRAVVYLDSLQEETAFGQGVLNLMTFLNYRSGSYVLRRDAEYQRLKLAVMKHQAPETWVEHLDKLASYSDRRTISLPEARKVDQLNKSGELLVAPISMLGDITIVPDIPYFSPEIKQEHDELAEEIREAKGITDEILAAKTAEMDTVSDAFRLKLKADLSSEERRKVFHERRAAIEAINDKYTAMETITDEERAEFERRNKNLMDRAMAEQERLQTEARREAMLRLEKQVKHYIAWAKSQQGW